MEDLIQVAPVETMELDDDLDDDEIEIPDMPPLVPPGGSGYMAKETNEEPAGASVEFTDSRPEGELSVGEGSRGLITGILFIVAGWAVIRLL